MKSIRNKGFTLIETMVVVGVISVLAAISLPAYQGYVVQARSAKVATHFEQAVRFVGTEMRRAQMDLAIGAASGAELDDRFDAAYLAEVLNAGGGVAPGGGPAYDDQASAEGASSGRVVITTSGSWAAQNYVAHISRPQAGGNAEPFTFDIGLADI